MDIFIIGAKIKEERKKKGLSQEYVARQANISRRILSGIENGNMDVKLSTITSILKVLNIYLEITPRS